MLAYITSLIQALIAMVMALVTTLPTNSPAYIAKFRNTCTSPSETQIQVGRNYVINPSFETNAGDPLTPTGWQRSSNLQPTDMSDCAKGESHAGSCSFHMGRYVVPPDEYVRSLTQVIPLSGKAGTKITVSGWAKAKKFVNVYPRLNTGFGIGVEMFDTNGESYLEPNGEGYANFPFGVHGYEPAITTFIASQDFLCMKAHVFFLEDGEVWFDDVSVTAEPPTGPYVSPTP